MWLSLPGVGAAAQTAALPVSVSVVESVLMRTSHQDAQLTVSAHDIQRGYLDVPAASQLEFVTNARACELVFYPVTGLFKSVEISSTYGTASLGNEGGSMVIQSHGQRRLNVSLNYRFVLSEQAESGVYTWPLVMSARTLR